MTLTNTGPQDAAHLAATGSLVRKSVQEEAMVTGWRPLSETSQLVTARWPRQHSFYVEGGRYSSLLLTESLRQALALLTHTVHDIPLTHRLGWEKIQSTVDPGALPTGSDSAEVELLVTHPQVKRRRLGSVHLTSHVEATLAGKPIGTATLRYSAHPPAIYNRLRGDYVDAARAFARSLPLTPPVPASHVGRSNTDNVVLSPTPGNHTWLLRVDTSHRVLFDHPHDHIPGMVLLEAAGQAAQVATMPRAMVPVDFDTTFYRYVEFDQRCLITAEPGIPEPDGRMPVTVKAHQGEHLVFSSTVTVQPQS
ncbi:ScbA/BarX family gamma-butyrolactone biosynthesis protein [Streptomyces sp. DG1A-41]|uniref:ScbA/BarX family gamma-butyrolactone biosynthesis protein n=1 Tax=Streptomyces sp. DG1A-41 TaxID=3125779 RepID=UPI0030CB90B8